jgi:phosphatidate phosphatase PAH1
MKTHQVKVSSSLLDEYKTLSGFAGSNPALINTLLEKAVLDLKASQERIQDNEVTPLTNVRVNTHTSEFEGVETITETEYQTVKHTKRKGSDAALATAVKRVEALKHFVSNINDKFPINNSILSRQLKVNSRLHSKIETLCKLKDFNKKNNYPFDSTLTGSGRPVGYRAYTATTKEAIEGNALIFNEIVNENA